MTVDVTGTREQWLEILDSRDREAIEDVLRHTNDDALLAATTWVEMATTEETIPHGTGPHQSVARVFVAEFHEFLCGNDPRYDAVRKEAGGSLHPQVAAASTLSAALGSHIGIAAAVVAPALTLLLIAASTASREAICQLFAEFLASNDEQIPGGGVDDPQQPQ